MSQRDEQDKRKGHEHRGHEDREAGKKGAQQHKGTEERHDQGKKAAQGKPEDHDRKGKEHRHNK